MSLFSPVWSLCSDHSVNDTETFGSVRYRHEETNNTTVPEEQESRAPATMPPPLIPPTLTPLLPDLNERDPLPTLFTQTRSCNKKKPSTLPTDTAGDTENPQHHAEDLQDRPHPMEQEPDIDNIECAPDIDNNEYAFASEASDSASISSLLLTRQSSFVSIDSDCEANNDYGNDPNSGYGLVPLI